MKRPRGMSPGYSSFLRQVQLTHSFMGFRPWSFAKADQGLIPVASGRPAWSESALTLSGGCARPAE